MISRSKVLAVGMTLGMTALVAGCGSASTNSNSATSTGPISGGTIVAALPPQTNITWYFPLGDAANLV